MRSIVPQSFSHTISNTPNLFLISVFIVFGIAISYWINYACKRTISSDDDLLWRLPLGLQCLWAVLVFIGMIPLCETPRWLISHGHDQRARKSLVFLRGHEAEEEFAEISEGLRAEAALGPVKWTDVVSKYNRKRLFIGCCLQMFQILTGSNVINYVSFISWRKGEKEKKYLRQLKLT